LGLGSRISKQEAAIGIQAAVVSRWFAEFFATITRKSGRGVGRWKFNLQILVLYRKTFLQLNSEKVRLTKFSEYLICMG